MTDDAGRSGPRAPDGTTASWLVRHGTQLAVLSILLFVAAVRLRVADVPLERDEGEYGYAAQLILHGLPPYQAAYNMKFPGTYYAYSVILALFGDTARGIHVGLIVVNAATILLLYLLARRLIGAVPAVVAAGTYALLSMEPRTLGLFAHATHFVLLPLLAGLLLALWAIDTNRRSALWAAGVLTGLAVLMKQHAALFVPPAVGFVLWRDWRRHDGFLARMAGATLLLAGSATPFAVLCAVLAGQGVLGAFWFWTIQYAQAYVSEVPLSEAPGMLASTWTYIAEHTLWLWLLGGAGLVLLWLGRWRTEVRVFLTGFVAASFLAVCPGFYFREHYFILLLPGVGLGAGVAIASLERGALRFLSRPAGRLLAICVFAAVAAVAVFDERAFFFSMGPDDLSRGIYGTETFVNARALGNYLRDRTSPADRIAVLGSEPEIYFYADRRSATGYIYTYALMEPQPHASRMQQEMIREIEAARPRYIVAVLEQTSWLVRPTSDQRILRWMAAYTAGCYEPVVAPGTTSPAQTGPGGGQAEPPNGLLLYRRAREGPCSASG